MGKLLRLPTNEERLIKLCRKGDRKAQKEVFEKYSAQMLSVGRRYVKSQEDAEEVLSNAFIKVFNKIDQYSNKGAFGGWIRRIMVNEALNFIKYQKNLFVEVDEENHVEISHQELNENIEADHLLQMIAELPIGYRTVFNLYAIEGFTHKEIAAKLEISENTSKSQLSKARKNLQDKLYNVQLLYKEQ